MYSTAIFLLFQPVLGLSAAADGSGLNLRNFDDKGKHRLDPEVNMNVVSLESLSGYIFFFFFFFFFFFCTLKEITRQTD